MNKDKINLYCLLIVGFFSFLGIALPYPIMAPLFLSATSPVLSFLDLEPSILYGIALASYPLGQFLGSPILGTISDQYGRKRILLISLLMTSLNYLFSIYALINFNFIFLVFSRFFTGFWEGNTSILRAAATDLHTIPKAKSFGYINAANAVGYVFGPLVSGFLTSMEGQGGFNPTNVFWFAFAFSILAIVLLFTLYKETFSKKNKAIAFNIFINFKFSWAPIGNTRIRFMLIMNTLFTLGFDIFYQFFPLFLVKKWKTTFFSISLITVVLSIAMILSQLFLIKKILKILNIKYSIIFSGIACSIFMLILILPDNYHNVFILFGLLGLCLGMLDTFLPVYVSDRISSDMQGQIMGLMMSLRFLGDGIFCLIGGILSSISLIAPFVIASICILLGIVVLNLIDYYADNRVI